MRLRTLAMSLILAFVSAIAFATLPPTPMPKAQFFDNAGRPLSGGKIYTYSPSTTTAKPTYTDSTGTVENANPVILDSAGRASIWLNGSYKFIVKDKNGYLLYTSDYVSVSPYLDALTAGNMSQWIPSGSVPSYVSSTQFSFASDQTTTFQAGRRYAAVVSGGTSYGTIVSSSYSGGITTVTVIYDSLSINTGINSVSVGILTPINSSVPIFPVSKIIASYTINASDFGKTLIVNNTNFTSDIIISIPSATAMPSGFWVNLKTEGTNTLYFPFISTSIYIDHSLPGYLYSNDSINLWTDGIIWYGKKITQTPGTENTIVATTSNGTISTGFVPGYIPGIMTGATATSGSAIVSTGATGTIASFPSVTVTSGDIIYYTVYAFSSRASDTTVSITPERYGLQRDSSSTAVIGLNMNSIYSSITPSGRTIIGSTLSSVATVSTGGSLKMDMLFICGDGTAGNDCTASMNGYSIFFKKQ